MEEKKKKELKPRADKYEEKVSFDGTFDELLELTIQPKKDMPSKTHTSDEIRIAFSISKTSVKNKLKSNDKIYTDDDWIDEIKKILDACGIKYDVETKTILSKNHHEITIK